MRRNSQDYPPVILLGGQENALSLVRSFGRRGVTVALILLEHCPALSSRYAGKRYPVPRHIEQKVYWQKLLLDNPEVMEELAGGVIFPGSDEALEFIAEHDETLRQHYRLDDARPDTTRAMLNKPQSMTLAEEAGCPIPLFQEVATLTDLDKIPTPVLYPVMIKPVYSHLFTRHFPNRKYLVANDERELRQNVIKLLKLDLEVIVTELIPGPDDEQSAYFSYINKEGKALFSYTHHIIRRYPKNSGSACLTVSRELPETAAMGRRFFEGANFRGMGHVEFKHDRRDGKLKIMECNPRMSAAQAIATASGMDMAWLIYRYLVFDEWPEQTQFRTGVRRWWVLLDIRAFLELRKLGEIGFIGWLRTIKGPPLVFPYFSLRDPMPFFNILRQQGSQFYRNRAKTFWRLAKKYPI